MTRLPGEVDEAIAERLFDDMDRLGWDGMTNPERSAQYERWLIDPLIGGRLVQFMDPTRARVWIKDGPVKEYSRASAGVGKYALLVDRGESEVPVIVTHALGPGWHPDMTTMQVKPLRVTAASDDDEAIVTWGPARDLKHLVWAALLARAHGDEREWVLAITSSFTHPVPAGQRSLDIRIASLVGVRLVHVELG